MSKLRLSALDADDLRVISAAIQDALVAVRDCAYFREEKLFRGGEVAYLGLQVPPVGVKIY